MIDLKNILEQVKTNIENHPPEYWEALIIKKVKEQEAEERAERFNAFKEEFAVALATHTEEEIVAQFDAIKKADPIYIEFQKEFALWNQETSHMSITHYYLVNKHFHRMIGMGWEVVEFIIEKMEKGDGFLLWNMMEAITGIYPNYSKKEGENASAQDCIDWWINWSKELI